MVSEKMIEIGDLFKDVDEFGGDCLDNVFLFVIRFLN